MKSIRLLGAGTLACGMALAFAGTALASNASDTTTGPDSTQTTTINNSTVLSNTNVNVTEVSNQNVQQASTGNVSAQNNTTVGGATSGSASNSNTAKTLINQSVQPAGTGQATGTVPTTGSGSNSSTTGNIAQPAGSGSVLGASTVANQAAAILPVTGATVPVDVSALRAAWHPQTAPTAVFAEQASGISDGMLAMAVLLSLLGGLGSALRLRRLERRV